MFFQLIVLTSGNELLLLALTLIKLREIPTMSFPMTNPMSYVSFVLASYVQWLDSFQKTYFPSDIETPFDWLKPVPVKDK